VTKPDVAVKWFGIQLKTGQWENDYVYGRLKRAVSFRW